MARRWADGKFLVVKVPVAAAKANSTNPCGGCPNLPRPATVERNEAPARTTGAKRHPPGALQALKDKSGVEAVAALPPQGRQGAGWVSHGV